MCSEKEYAKRFQGKPDKIVPLMNSNNPSINENIRIFLKIFFDFKKNLNMKKAILQKKLNIAGMNIIAIGIKNLKLSSYKSEKGIQYMLEKK